MCMWVWVCVCGCGGVRVCAARLIRVPPPVFTPLTAEQLPTTHHHPPHHHHHLPPTSTLQPCALVPGDVVEMRCTSSSGRSPWLESVVLRVDSEGDKHYVGNSINGGKAVPRAVLRLVRRAPQPSPGGRTPGRCSVM